MSGASPLSPLGGHVPQRPPLEDDFDDEYDSSSGQQNGGDYDKLEELRPPSEADEDEDVNADVMNTSPLTLIYRSIMFLVALFALKYLVVLMMVAVQAGLDARDMRGLAEYSALRAERRIVLCGRLATALSHELYERTDALQPGAPAPAPGYWDELASDTDALVYLATQQAQVGVTAAWLDSTLRSPLLNATADAPSPEALRGIVADVGGKIAELSELILGDLAGLLRAADGVGYNHLYQFFHEQLAVLGAVLPQRGSAEEVHAAAAAAALCAENALLLLPEQGDLKAATALLETRRSRAVDAAGAPLPSGRPPPPQPPKAVLARLGDLAGQEERGVLDAVFAYDRSRQESIASLIAMAVVVVSALLFTALEMHQEYRKVGEEAHLRSGFAHGDETAQIIRDYSNQIETCTKDGRQYKQGRINGLQVEAFFQNAIDALSILRPYIPNFVFSLPPTEDENDAKEEIDKYNKRRAGVPHKKSGKAPRHKHKTPTMPHLEPVVNMTGSDNDSLAISMSSHTSSRVSSTGSQRSSRSSQSSGSVTNNVDTAMGRLLEEAEQHLSLETGVQKSAVYTLCKINTSDMHRILTGVGVDRAESIVGAFLETVHAHATQHDQGRILQHSPVATLLCMPRRMQALLAVDAIVTAFNAAHAAAGAAAAITAAVGSAKYHPGLITCGMKSTFLFCGAGMTQLERISRLTRVLQEPILANGAIYRSLAVARSKKLHREWRVRPCSVVRAAGQKNATLQVVYACWKAPAEPTGDTGPDVERQGSLTDPVADPEAAQKKRFELVVMQCVKDPTRGLKELEDYIQAFEKPADALAGTLTATRPRTAYLWEFLKQHVGMIKEGDHY